MTSISISPPAPLSSRPRVLWLHTQPEHYFNCMMDALAASSDFTYIAAFMHRGAKTYTEVPVPLKAQSLFLKPKPGMQDKPLHPYRAYHQNWRADLLPLNYDFVIVSGYAGPTPRQVIRDARARGIPVAMFSDSNLRSQRGRTCKMRLKRALKKRLLAPIIRDTSVLLTANSLGVAYWRYFGAPKNKIVVCPYYADYDRVDRARATNRAEVLAQYNLAPQDKLIVTAARLVPAKGLHLMIKAFQQSNLAARGYKYLLAGTGPLEAELKALAGSDLHHSIRFLGFLQPSQLLALIHHAALFAFPSIYEPHGIVVHESLAAETPVLSSDVGGAAYDLVLPNQSGWLFRSGDQADLLRILTSATADESKLTALRATSRAVFEQWFARTNPVTVVDRLAHQLLAGKSFSPAPAARPERA